MKKLAITLGVIIVALGLVSCGQSDLSKQELEKITSTHTILELQQKMASGELTSLALVDFYLAKIAAEDHSYNSIIATNPNARALAKEADKRRQEGEVLGPLHGIPIVVKDNIETQTMATTAGSFALQNNKTNKDAPLVANLKKQGAIILAKTNLSEWANFRSTRSSSGWSGIGGQTRNPHDTSRSTCGSSSGSGAAIAANLAVAAVGTETDGSITCPSSVNGIVGIKPNLGVISQQGIVPIAHSQDTAGPMAKSVTDAAILLEAMATPSVLERKVDSALKSEPLLKEMKIGVLHSPATNHEQVQNLFSDFQKVLSKNNIELTEELHFSPYDGLFGDEYSVLLYEFKHDLNQYLAGLPNDYKDLTLEKLIEFNLKNSDKEMPFFQQEIFELAQAKGGLDEEEYQTQLAKIKGATREDGLDKLYADNELDGVIAITLGPSWKIDRVNGDHYSGGVSSYSAISGYPHITIPLGKVHGLPIGLSVIGNANSDLKMINIAKQLEDIIKQWHSNR